MHNIGQLLTKVKSNKGDPQRFQQKAFPGLDNTGCGTPSIEPCQPDDVVFMIS
jgi:hypothetical protein